jgi:hypothetical protein
MDLRFPTSFGGYCFRPLSPALPKLNRKIRAGYSWPPHLYREKLRIAKRTSASQTPWPVGPGELVLSAKEMWRANLRIVDIPVEFYILYNVFLMEPDESHDVSNVARQTDDAALAMKILLSQTEVDREAIVRFYVKGQTAEQIEEALGLDAGYVGRLKRLIKDRWRKRQSKSTAPPAAASDG